MTEGQAFTLAMFKECLGETFQVRDESGKSFSLELIDATAGNGQQSRDGRESFSVIFHDREATAASYLQQAIYRFEHAAVGPLDLFIVPLGPDVNGGIRYEAVFT